jgi:signal peptidase I
VSAFFVWVMACLLKAAKASYWRASMAVVLVTMLGLLLSAPALHLQSRLEAERPLLALATLMALATGQIVGSWLIIRWLVHTTFVRAIAVWAAGLILPGTTAVVFVILVIKPYVVEAFVVPTNAMAPTVIGWHKRGVCPQCQELLIVSASPPGELRPFEFEELEVRGICTSCLQSSLIPRPESVVHSPDRILCNKLLLPQRWDLIVFRYPLEPSRKYMKRLVALPGEELYIKEGALWINGTKVDLPAELGGLRYTTEFDGGMPVRLGTEENPLRLGEDEYGVLGDFSLRANDSREFGPVPGSYIEGVVTVRYWPMERWQLFR